MYGVQSAVFKPNEVEGEGRGTGCTAILCNSLVVLQI
jgi:hypothetical protein